MVSQSCRLVLVVESDVESAKYATLLSSPDYEIRVAATPDDLLGALPEFDPSVVVYSMGNTSLDGEALVRAVRAERPDLPIVLVALGDDDERILALLEAGATEFLHHAAGRSKLLFRMIERNHRAYRQGQKVAALNGKLQESLTTLENDQWAGFRVQQAMMPVAPVAIDSIAFDYRLYPTLILSGDFIDYFELPDGRLLFYLADVSGHGAASAFVTVLLKSLVRKLEFGQEKAESAGDALTWLNREICFCQMPQHVTMFLAMIDADRSRLDYANAAHFPGALLKQPGGDTRYLETGNLPLGLAESTAYDSRLEHLSDGFSIVLFSDGVFEIMAEPTLADKEASLHRLVKCNDAKLDVLVESLGITAAGAVPDDIAVLAVSEAC